MSRWVRLWSAFVGMVMIGNLQYAWTLFAQPMVKAHAQQHWTPFRCAVGLWPVHRRGHVDHAVRGLIHRQGRSPTLYGSLGAALRGRVGIAGARRQPDFVLPPLLPWRALASRACTHAESRSR